jgi:hypothetical protein
MVIAVDVPFVTVCPLVAGVVENTKGIGQENGEARLESLRARCLAGPKETLIKLSAFHSQSS